MDNDDEQVPGVTETYRYSCGHTDTVNSQCHACGQCEDCCPPDDIHCENGCGQDFRPCSYPAVHYCQNCDQCGDCHARESWYCNGCGQEYCGEFRFDNMSCNDCTRCNHCECECRELSRDYGGRGIMDYSTNVVEALRADPPEGVRTYGIELEVSARNEDKLEEIVATINANRELKKLFICKSDGSLPDDTGVEIVSVPLPLGQLKDAVTLLFERALKNGRVLESDDHCGTHIHVGRDTVTPRTIARAWAPWAYSGQDAAVGYRWGGSSDDRKQKSDEDMKVLLRALAGRKPNTYCQWNVKPPVVLTGKRKRDRVRYTDHYNAISCSSHHPTYEWRMFSGCTRLATALRYLETVDCLLSIAEETHGLEVCFNSKMLLEEIGKRIDRYPNLAETFATPGKKLSRFFDVVESARKGVPRKQRGPALRNGIEVPVEASASIGNPKEQAVPKLRGSLEVGMKFLGKLATPPPKGVYIQVDLSNSPAPTFGMYFLPCYSDATQEEMREVEERFATEHGTGAVSMHPNDYTHVGERPNASCVCVGVRRGILTSLRDERPQQEIEPPTLASNMGMATVQPRPWTLRFTHEGVLSIDNTRQEDYADVPW